MVLRDAVSLLLCLSEISCEPGEYKVINSNPYSYKIIELAEIVKKQFLDALVEIARVDGIIKDSEKAWLNNISNVLEVETPDV